MLHEERIPLVLACARLPLNLIHIQTYGGGDRGRRHHLPITTNVLQRTLKRRKIVEEFAHRVLSISGMKQTNKYDGTAQRDGRKIHTSQNNCLNRILPDMYMRCAHSEQLKRSCYIC